MGRAQIVSGGPDGRYTIRVDVGESRRDQLVIAAQQNVDQVTAALSTAQARYEAYQAETEALRVVAEADVQAYVDAIAAHGPTSMQAGEAFLKQQKSSAALELARSREFPERVNRDNLRVTLKEAQARLSRWQGLVLSDTRQAWCADFTEGAAGAVATIEVNGESDLILVKPGAPAPTAADGALLSRELMSPEQAFFNAGILPGWQAYKPTYRRGTITALDRDAHRCSVTLAAATSSAQRLNVNQGTSLTNVPIAYMTCHSDAFEVGDQVVVMFDDQAWQSPRVIGFVTDPRPCAQFSLVYRSTLYGILSSQTVVKGRDAEPVVAEAPAVPNAWAGWSDGITTTNRHDLDIQDDLDVTARYISGAPANVSASLGIQFLIVDDVLVTNYKSLININLPAPYVHTGGPIGSFDSGWTTLSAAESFMNGSSATATITQYGQTVEFTMVLSLEMTGGVVGSRDAVMPVVSVSPLYAV